VTWVQMPRFLRLPTNRANDVWPVLFRTHVYKYFLASGSAHVNDCRHDAVKMGGWKRGMSWVEADVDSRISQLMQQAVSDG